MNYNFCRISFVKWESKYTEYAHVCFARAILWSDSDACAPTATLTQLLATYRERIREKKLFELRISNYVLLNVMCPERTFS